MPTAEAVKSLWGRATPANAANPAKPRMNTGFAGLRTVCEFCECAAAKRGRDSAANSVKSRINTIDSQNSQPRPEGKCRSLPEQQAVAEIRKIRRPFATAGTRINTSDSQDSHDSQGDGGGNPFSPIAARLLGLAAVALKPYPAHRVRCHALGD